uniref:Uncharacterized protein n=1 Tax=Haemonchus contortus TaxID=6289 RepID=A0A7I4YUU6_HAECO
MRGSAIIAHIKARGTGQTPSAITHAVRRRNNSQRTEEDQKKMAAKNQEGKAKPKKRSDKLESTSRPLPAPAMISGTTSASEEQKPSKTTRRRSLRRKNKKRASRKTTCRKSKRVWKRLRKA